MKTPLQDVNTVQVRRTRCKASSNNSNQVVATGKMVYSEKNESKEKKLKVVEKIIADEKENTPKIVRRSKRTVAESVTNVENVSTTSKSAKNVKVKKPSKKAKGESKSKTKKGQSNKNDNQTKLDPIIEKEVPNAVKPEPEKSTLTTTNSPAVTEDSGICNIPSLQNSLNYSVAVFNSPDVRSIGTPCLTEYSLTTDSPSADYWKEIAEQRQLALEKTLYENEMLHDQLEVLVADNQQLKQMVKEAEDLAETVKALIG